LKVYGSSFQARRACQFPKFPQRFFGPFLLVAGDADQHGPWHPLGSDPAYLAAHLFLGHLYQLEGVVTHLVRIGKGLYSPSGFVGGNEIGKVCPAGDAVGADFQSRDQIESHQQEISEILPCKASWLQVRVYEPKAAQVSGTEAKQPQVGDEDTSAISYQDMGDVPPAVYENTQLPACFPGQLRHSPGCLGGDNLFGLRFASAQAFDTVDLARFQACCFSFDPGYGVSSEIRVRKQYTRVGKM
jgi:hypothetical protein